MYADDDTPLPFEEPHGTTTTTGYWICVQKRCDGTNHWYLKMNSLGEVA